LIARGVVVVLFLWMARAYLAPVLLGGLLAIMLHPAHRRLAPRIGTNASAFLLVLGVLAIAVLPLALLALRATAALTSFMQHEWPATMRHLRDYLTGNDSPLGLLGLDGSAISSGTDALVQSVAGAITQIAATLVTSVPSQVIALFLLCAAVFYLVAEGPRVVAWLERESPFSTDDTADLITTVHRTVRGVVTGVLATALVQGGLTVLALVIFGVPAAFALGVMAGLLSIVPLLGTTPVTIGAIVYLASVDRIEAAVGMTIAAVVIGVSDNLVRPYLMHVATPHQHPLVILLGVFGGVTVFGAAGVFLGPVLAALAAWAVLSGSSARTSPARAPIA
jgi:predicted PurR-regulated permease PerM